MRVEGLGVEETVEESADDVEDINSDEGEVGMGEEFEAGPDVGTLVSWLSGDEVVCPRRVLISDSKSDTTSLGNAESKIESAFVVVGFSSVTTSVMVPDTAVKRLLFVGEWHTRKQWNHTQGGEKVDQRSVGIAFAN